MSQFHEGSLRAASTPLAAVGATKLRSRRRPSLPSSAAPFTAPRWLIRRVGISLLAILGACASESLTEPVEVDPDSGPAPDSQPAAPVLLRITVPPVADPLPVLGATVDLDAVGEFDDGVSKTLTGVVWSSADELVGTVDAEGTFTARGNGSTEVIARLGEIAGRTTVRVQQSLNRIRLTAPGDTAFSLGVRARFKATVLDLDGRPVQGAPPIRWSSADVSVATVDSQGRVTPVAPGSAVIVAEAGTFREERELHVVNRVPVTIDLARAEALQWVLEDSVAAWGYPGGIAAVSFPNGEMWLGAAGRSRGNRQMNPELESYFASVTKTLIAAVLHQFVVEGRLAYDDAIRTLLPARANIDPDITVEQLLGHTSGLFDYALDGGGVNLEALIAAPNRLWTPGELLTTFVGPPQQAPGVSASYSNTNALVLGEIIQVVSGRPYYEEVRRRLLDPLGLGDTYFGTWEEGTRERVTGYLPNGTTGTRIEVPSVESFAGPTGGVVSTVSDMARWSRLLFAGDVLPPAAQARLRIVEPLGSSGGEQHDVEILGIGQGAFTTRTSGNTFVGHGGTFPHIQAAIAHSDDLNLSVSFVVNQTDVVPSIEARLSSVLLSVASGPTGAPPPP